MLSNEIKEQTIDSIVGPLILIIRQYLHWNSSNICQILDFN